MFCDIHILSKKTEKSLKMTSKLMLKMKLRKAAFRFEALWRPTWSPKGAQSRQKSRPTEPLESALGKRGARMLPNAARGCPGPRKWSPQGSKRDLKSQKKHNSRNLIQIDDNPGDPARNTA